MENNTISKDRIKELLKKYHIKKEAIQDANSNTNVNVDNANADSTNKTTDETTSNISIDAGTKDSGRITEGVGRDGSIIKYNDKQQEFINLASIGESCILIGAAGTGKTTCQRGAIGSLIQNGKAGVLSSEGHKHLVTGTPGIVICAYTRRAVMNIRKAMPDDMKENCITIHKLLEYEPVFYSVFDAETGKERNTMKFEPTRNQIRPLPQSIRTIVLEESSMIDLDLWEKLNYALQHQVQFIFLGDIQQLPPVFGSAILGYKMLELPTIELTEVYRQALESPIIKLAHRILSGNPIGVSEFKDWKYEKQLTLHPWKKKLNADNALFTAAKFFTNALDANVYDPNEDIILIPFNKSFGSDELNKHIANHIAKKGRKIVWEIVAGFKKVYLSVGDRILYDKEDAEIIEIKKNPTYTGKSAQAESEHMDYWGFSGNEKKTQAAMSESDIDFLLEQVASGDGEDKVNLASHIIVIRMADSLEEIALDSAGEINNLLMGYALTIHKSQGSEWRKVFLVIQQTHATMIQRELLYTAVTRAKQELYVICEPDTFVNGIKSQRIKGNTLAEKAAYFKGRLDLEKKSP